MKKDKEIFKKAISIEEMEARLHIAGTGLVILLSGSSCINSMPTLP